MKVSCSEGRAYHAGPESCVRHREMPCEALTGEGIGQPLSRERISHPDADMVLCMEGNMGASAKRARTRSGVVRDPGMCRRSSYGNRDVSGTVRRRRRPDRSGKVRSRSR